MRFIKREAQPENHPKPRKKTAKEGVVVALAFLGPLLASVPGRSEVQMMTPAPQSQVEAKATISDIDWKRTHLVIINGDREPRHKKNAIRAAEAGLKNNVAAVYVAGLAEDEITEIKRYDGSTLGIEKMLEEVKENSKDGDTVFVYITGHGDPKAFILEKMEKLDDETLLNMLEQNLDGRKIIFVSDACYSANFVDLLMESGKFPYITAMSPGLENEETSCTYFAQPFWHALSDGLDLDGNRITTLEETFYYGLKEYRKYKPETFGSFRKSIPKIKSMKEVKNGVVMVTADYCGPCKMMEEVLNTAGLLLKGNIDFYLIDVKNASDVDATPTIFIIKNGKVTATGRGAMEFKRFCEWLNKNGLEVEKFGISAKRLYEQGKYDSIVQVLTWKEIKDELGIEKSINVVTPLLNSKDSKILANAVEILGDAVEDIPLHEYLNYDELIERLKHLFKDEDFDVRYSAAETFGKIAGMNPDILVPYLGMLLKRIDFRMRQCAAIALGNAAEKIDLSSYDGIVGRLVLHLEGSHESVRPFVARTLGIITANNPDKLLPYLENMIKEVKKEDWENAELEGEKVAELEEAKELNWQVARVFGVAMATKPDKVEPYLRALLNDEKKRETALEALEIASPHVNLMKYEKTTRKLMEFLKIKNSEVPYMAAKVLSGAAINDPDKSFPYLKRILEHEDPEIVQGAIWGLGGSIFRHGLKEHDEFLTLLVQLLGDNNEMVRRGASRVLGIAVVRNPDIVVPHLKELLRNENKEVVVGAAMALGVPYTYPLCVGSVDLSKYEGVVELLRELANDEDKKVVLHAAEVLVYVDKKANVSNEVLAKRLKGFLNDEDAELRADALVLLDELGEEVDLSNYPGTVKRLVGLLRDKGSYSSAALALGIAATKNPDVLVPLLRGLLDYENPSLREGGVDALGAAAEEIDLSKYEGVVERLVGLLRDKDLNSDASWTLGIAARKNPDRLVPLLRELSRDKNPLVREGAANALDIASRELDLEDYEESETPLNDDDEKIKSNVIKVPRQIEENNPETTKKHSEEFKPDEKLIQRIVEGVLKGLNQIDKDK